MSTFYRCDRCRLEITSFRSLMMPRPEGDVGQLDRWQGISESTKLQLCDKCVLSYREWWAFNPPKPFIPGGPGTIGKAVKK